MPSEKPSSDSNQSDSAPQGTPAIVIFGGTFDPIHYGHLRAAAEVKTIMGAVDFRLMPSGNPPHRETTTATAQQRLDMLKIALEAHPDLTIDEREVKRSGPSYMYDTLLSLRQDEPQSPIILVLGQDAANHFHQWHHWQEILHLCHLLIMTRPESTAEYPPSLTKEFSQREVTQAEKLCSAAVGYIFHTPITQLAISATHIRNLIASGQEARFLLPDDVINFIRFNNLYKFH